MLLNFVGGHIRDYEHAHNETPDILERHEGRPAWKRVRVLTTLLSRYMGLVVNKDMCDALLAYVSLNNGGHSR